MKTYSPKPEHIERRWYIVDASDQVLGRLASEVAALLRGKHKPIFAPHMDTGDHVIVINADKVTLTGGKRAKKVAYRHSGYPGGITGVRYDVLLATRPVFAVEKAIKGMLPKNRLGRSMIKKLHVLAGPQHPHGPQQPVAYTLGQPPMWEGLPEPSPTPLKSRHLREKADEPTTKPKTSKPAAKRSSANAPASKAPTGKKATAKAAEKSPAKKPTAKEPTAKEPTAKEPTTSAESAPTSKAEGTEE